MAVAVAVQMLDLSPVDPYGYTRQVALQQAAPDLSHTDIEALSILTKMLTLRPVGAVASHAVGALAWREGWAMDARCEMRGPRSGVRGPGSRHGHCHGLSLDSADWV